MKEEVMPLKVYAVKVKANIKERALHKRPNFAQSTESLPEQNQQTKKAKGKGSAATGPT